MSMENPCSDTDGGNQSTGGGGLSQCHLACHQCDVDWPWIRCYGPAIAGRRGTFQNIVFSFTLCVLFFEMATKLSGQTVIKLFGPNCWIKGSVRCLFWPWSAVKKLLKPWGGAVSRESLGTAGLKSLYGCSSRVRAFRNGTVVWVIVLRTAGITNLGFAYPQGFEPKHLEAREKKINNGRKMHILQHINLN